MRCVSVGVLLLVAPALGPAQTPAPRGAPAYRGLTPGLSYRAFVERADAVADHDTLACNTSRRTAAVMECGVAIRDPADGARFYLSGHFIEQNADIIALYDSAGFRDTRGRELLARTQRDLTRVFGRPHPVRAGTWEWRYGRQVVRLTWRARGAARWVSITLTDKDVMDRIARYLKAPVHRKS